MKIGIITNPERDRNYRYTKQIQEFLQAQGLETVLQNTSESCVTPAIQNSRFVIVLGGDGTMLRAAGAAAVAGVPMLGINLGTLGYLTDVDMDEGLDAIQKALAGEFRRERRMMLVARNQLALNEVHVYSAGAKLGTFSVEVNGSLMDVLRADGVIVGTPTGSTAYNLSAGGPILKPDSEMLVITPICPHALYTRPWVLDAGDTVSVAAVETFAKVAVDGQESFELAPGESLTITKAQHFLQIIRTSGMDFFEILRKKLVE